MLFPTLKRIGRAALGVVFLASAGSCNLLTLDCGGPTSRETLAEATVRDLGDTLSVDPIAAVYEERDHDGSYLHQLQINIQATDAAHYDTIPAGLRPHVTGVRIEVSSGTVLYRVAMTGNSSQRYGPPVLAAIAVNDVDQPLFDLIRAQLVANTLFAAIESDSTVHFPRTALHVQYSYDWRKQACQ